MSTNKFVGTSFYHGSNCIIKNPIIKENNSTIGKELWDGFYLTPALDSAIRYAENSPGEKSIINEYAFYPNKLAGGLSKYIYDNALDDDFIELVARNLTKTKLKNCQHIDIECKDCKNNKCPRNCDYIYSVLIDGILDDFIYSDTIDKNIIELEQIIYNTLKKNKIIVSQLVVRNNALKALQWVSAYSYDVTNGTLQQLERMI